MLSLHICNLRLFHGFACFGMAVHCFELEFDIVASLQVLAKKEGNEASLPPFPQTHTHNIPANSGQRERFKKKKKKTHTHTHTPNSQCILHSLVQKTTAMSSKLFDYKTFVRIGPVAMVGVVVVRSAVQQFKGWQAGKEDRGSEPNSSQASQAATAQSATPPSQTAGVTTTTTTTTKNTSAPDS